MNTERRCRWTWEHQLACPDLGAMLRMTRLCSSYRPTADLFPAPCHVCQETTAPLAASAVTHRDRRLGSAKEIWLVLYHPIQRCASRCCPAVYENRPSGQ